MGGAGTRTFKMRGGMGLLGVLGKYGMYRLNNSMALLDAKIRGVKPEEAKAGRNLVQLHLARRPGARPSVGARPAGVRLRLQRPARSRSSSSWTARTWSRTS